MSDSNTTGMTPDLTLIVCTRNRAEQLRRTLAFLNRIVTERHWELVIVDNGSTDSTPEVIHSFAATAGIHVSKIVEPREGLSRARNAGCRAAEGAIIAFTDDDCYPRDDYVDAVLNVFEESPDLGFIGGRVLLHDPSDAAVTIREQTEPELLDSRTFPRPGFIHGANMAIRREVLDDIGEFDICLGAGTRLGSGEDIELCARAVNRGWDGGYYPSPTVRHHHARKPGPELEGLRRRYDRGRGAYYAKTFLDFTELRYDCLRKLYWRFREGIPWLKMAREGWGGLLYVWCRMLTGLSRSRA